MSSVETAKAEDAGHPTSLTASSMFAIDEEAFSELQKTQPWRSDPYFFKNVKISTLAALKMLSHAQSGEKIEVMGLLQGKITLDPPTFLILDAFALPVEGTETRVDAQSEGYEYTVQYTSFIREYNQPSRQAGTVFPIIGWY